MLDMCTPTARVSGLGRLGRFLTWACILGSIAPQGFALRQAWTSRDHSLYVMRSAANGRSHESWGLTYTPPYGKYLLLVEVLLILTSAGFSLLERALFRRFGLLILLAWSFVYLTNAVIVTYRFPPFFHYVPLIGSAVFTTAMIVRLVCNWRRKTDPTDGSLLADFVPETLA